MDDGLPDRWRSGVFSVLEFFQEIAKARIFGSRSLGRFHKGSDLDLAVESFDGQPISRDRLRMLRAMIDALNIPIDVDLVDVNAVSDPYFRSVIERDGRVWWTRTPAENPARAPSP